MKNRYEVVVTTTMSASVWVEAETEQEAYDIVDSDICTIDYCNETCGFDFSDDAIQEINNVTCGGYIELENVYEAR